MGALGILLMWVGYAMMYSGFTNVTNGVNGPTVWEAMGFTNVIAPPRPFNPPTDTTPAPDTVST